MIYTTYEVHIHDILMSGRLALDFIKASIVYFLIGTLWMGFSEPLGLPSPREEFAHMIYNLGMIHILVIGWASLAIMGVLYYVVPKAVDRELHSARLGRVHFWVTNITLPIAVLDTTYGGFVMDPLFRAGLSEEEVLGHPSVGPFFLVYLMVSIIGYAAQFLFAYNIYKTAKK